MATATASRNGTGHRSAAAASRAKADGRGAHRPSEDAAKASGAGSSARSGKSSGGSARAAKSKSGAGRATAAKSKSTASRGRAASTRSGSRSSGGRSSKATATNGGSNGSSGSSSSSASRNGSGSTDLIKQVGISAATGVASAAVGVAGGILLGRTAAAKRPRKVLGIELPHQRKADFSGLSDLAKSVGDAGKQFGKLAGEVRQAREKAEQIGRVLS